MKFGAGGFLQDLIKKERVSWKSAHWHSFFHVRS